MIKYNIFVNPEILVIIVFAHICRLFIWCGYDGPDDLIKTYFVFVFIVFMCNFIFAIVVNIIVW